MGQAPAQDDIDTEALAAAVQETVLFQAAKAEGIGFSDDEIIQRVRSMQDRVNASGDPQAQQAFQWAAQNAGVSDAEFASDPRIIAAYRKAFTVGEMRSRIIAAIPLDRRSDPAATHEAIIEFIQNRHATVRSVDDSVVASVEVVKQRLSLR